MANNKDTIYIDVDDEITGIIDKLRTSDSKVVALVLPKRASVFQSIVNMRLLKRAADNDKKNLVLITSEAGLLPLAGAAGVHVAKTLTSKPEIPQGPQDIVPNDDEEIQEDMDPADDEPIDASKPVGQLAGGAAAAGAVTKGKDGIETLALDDDVAPEEVTESTPKTFTPTKKKKDKKLAVPNFERFRLWLILGVLALIVLIGGFIFLNGSLARAEINVKTDATSVNVGLDLDLSTAAKTAEDNTLPAKVVTQQKTYTQSVPTTGQKNNGNKASGTVNLTNCMDRDGDITIPAGSSFSAGGNTFITQESVTLNESQFNRSDKCTSKPSGSVQVLAQNGGAAYNGATSFAAGSPYGGVTGTGSTSGGTDSIVQTVNANDLTSAKAKIVHNDTEMKKTLTDQLRKDNYYAVAATYQAGTPAQTNSANVGDVANTVTVTETITYTMFGVHESDLKNLIEDEIKSQIDAEQQSILDNGLNKAVFNVNNITATNAQLSMSTKATAGPDIDVNSIRQDAKGKRAGAIRDDLKTNPDVTDVDVKLSPFWVKTVPKNDEHIKVNIAKPTTTVNSSSESDDNP